MKLEMQCLTYVLISAIDLERHPLPQRLIRPHLVLESEGTLHLLREFRRLFDTVKIDRSFVARVFDGAKERAVTAAIIALAHAAGMTVVAEGVETCEQLRLMHDLGADEIQGYFFSWPVPVSECDPFLQKRCDVERGGTA